LLAIATGKSRAGLDRALAHQGIARHFICSRCADEGAPKPNPDMLLHLMHAVGAEAASTLMIGDTTHDLELAQNAGVAALAVSYGAHDPSHFDPFRPLAMLHSVAALREWLLKNG
jgi:phosphoglycolate phosphatase